MLSDMELGRTVDTEENQNVIQEKLDNLENKTVGMRQNLIQQSTDIAVKEKSENIAQVPKVYFERTQMSNFNRKITHKKPVQSSVCLKSNTSSRFLLKKNYVPKVFLFCIVKSTAAMAELNIWELIPCLGFFGSCSRRSLKTAVFLSIFQLYLTN